MAYTKTNWQDNQEPSINEGNLNKIEQGIEDAHITADNALARAGGVMTGPLTLSGVPTSDLHAATKSYVDSTGGGGGGGGWGHIINPGHNTLLNAVSAGHLLITMNPGHYTNDAAIVMTTPAQRIQGGGGNTRVTYGNSSGNASSLPIIPYFFDVGATTNNTDRVQLSGFMILCQNRAQVGIAQRGITSPPSNYFEGEPDNVSRFENLWIHDASVYGIHTLPGNGNPGRASHWHRIRIRRAGLTGFMHEQPDSWITDCEATTATGATGTTTTGAGLHIATSNTYIQGFKSWYCRNYGYLVRGTRNAFVNCHSQDTRNHGWFIDWDRNIFIGIMADSAAFFDVGGTLNGADGIYVAGGSAGLPSTSIQGAFVFDRQVGGTSSQQRYGINAPSSMFVEANESGSPQAGGQVRITGVVGYDNATALINKR